MNFWGRPHEERLDTTSPIEPIKTLRAKTTEELGLEGAFYFAYCVDCGMYIGVVSEPDLELRCSDCALQPSWAAGVIP